MLNNKKLTMAFLALLCKKSRVLAFFLKSIPSTMHYIILGLYFILTAISFVNAEEKRLPFKGYGSYFPQFKLFCEAVHQDGRGEYLSKTALLFSERDTGCEACRPLFQTIVQTCKVPAPKKNPQQKASKKVEDSAPEVGSEEVIVPTPTPTPIPILNREPSALVIDRSVRLFSQIAEDKAINDRTIPALYKLFFVLTDATKATPAEKEYFDILQSFVMPLFAELQNKKETGGEKSTDSKSEVNSSEHLESLFDQ